MSKTIILPASLLITYAVGLCEMQLVELGLIVCFVWIMSFFLPSVPNGKRGVKERWSSQVTGNTKRPASTDTLMADA